MKIEVKNVSKSFKEISVLNNINATFENGKISCLAAENPLTMLILPILIF